MNISDIKKKASEQFTEYLNHTIDFICRNDSDKNLPDDFFPLEIFKNNARFSDTLKEHSQEMVDLYLHSKNKTGVGYSIEMESISTRSSGRKSIIKKIYFAEENDFLDFINVKNRVDYLKSALTILVQDEVLPINDLRNWAKKHIRDLTVFYGEASVFWHNIAQSALYMNPNIKDKKPIEVSLYLPADFMEKNKKLIKSLTGTNDSDVKISSTQKRTKIEPVSEEIVQELPETIVETTATEIMEEEKEFTAKTKTFFIRFRSLSADSPLKLGRLIPKEISLPLDDFIHLNQTVFLKGITTVLIVDNENVFQSFPSSEHVLCIFGPDYAVNALKLCEWFGQYQLIYFGDISEHCFNVLSTFRNSWGKTESLCMDGNTWEKFFNETEKGTHLKNNSTPKNLTNNEKNTFLSLRLTAGKSRLSQEKIPNDYMKNYLEAIKIQNETEEDASKN